ncbi:mitogen-activated protein kinase kinase kinase NPK1 [Solanum lycopersicum]|uniref:mitogen-activated protein kinase kinase kinase n=1 Tax=Solanum lycopersicum TaxID=4081 RepID=A0A3Q7EH53_SOLLC|nr:mitogen-activated protein kinase kinase kinase NPK1 [Solanum lycopersicum]
MQDFIGSVRRSLVFKPSGDSEIGAGSAFGGFVEKIGSSIRKSSIGIFSKSQVPALPAISKAESLPVKADKKDDNTPIRWRKGEMIGCGAFGRVYMGMNVDSGELLAIKEVSIAMNGASRERAQAHVRELEEEVNLLKNLSHPNIVRYLGTAREVGSLNILLEFVPGGSISSLLGKFGSFPESVIRMYTKQLLLGLEYLHKNGIMHRDIKGANILVDNKGCIKLADFGASKKVVELATMTGAKSMKGTPYWMAPEVILQTGHSFSADIWSVGCTIIEMATGKPPWSQQYQEVAALFHIGTTKSHPPIPEHLSAEAKDFLLKCLQKEPHLRTSASNLLQHPFVTGEHQEAHTFLRSSFLGNSENMAAQRMDVRTSTNPDIRATCNGLKDVCDVSTVRCSTVYPENSFGNESLWKLGNSDDDMCQMDNDDFMFGASVKCSSDLHSHANYKSFNPMSEPDNDWPCKFDESPVLTKSQANLDFGQATIKPTNSLIMSYKEDAFAFSGGQSAAEDDDELTESKIRAFLDEKAMDLKKLQSPLYEEFLNSMNVSSTPSLAGIGNKENFPSNVNLPPKSRSPKRFISRRLSTATEGACAPSPVTHSKRISNIGGLGNEAIQELQSPRNNEWKDPLGSQRDAVNSSFSERQRKWKEELDEELQRKREIMRQAVNLSPPMDPVLNRCRSKSRFASPGR